MKTKNVWIIFLSIVAVCAISFGVYAQMNAVNNKTYAMKEDDHQMTLENHYKESLYQLADSMKNINANLGKISVSNNTKQQQKLLLLVEGAADAAGRDLSLLPMDAEVVEKSLKYTNQVSDYAKTLSEKLYTGGNLSVEERTNLSALENVSENLYMGLNYAAMNDLDWKVDDTGYGFVNMEGMDENVFDYPQLIYDGPFSDAVVDKTVQFESKISPSSGEAYIMNAFRDYNISSVAYGGKVDGKIMAYAYDMITTSGDVYRILFTPDGRVAQFNGNVEQTDMVNTQELDLENFQKTAVAFANNLGFSVKAIWTSQPIENRVYVNMCFVQDDIVVYPDMIKVALNLDGKVVGFESLSYLLNHKERELTSDYSNIENGIERLSKTVQVVGINKAVIPLGQKEYFCYEFVCEKGNDTYLIYLDTLTLVERDISKVVKGIEGYSVI